jgi:hypothetical protein
MKFSERLAKVIVERVILGASMHFRISQGSGERDFDLELPDGSIVPLEVTTASDECVNKQIAATVAPGKGGSFVPRQLSQSDWWIHPQLGANINQIRKNVDAYLADIEVVGLMKFAASTDCLCHAVYRIWQDLGIEAGATVTWDPPGRIGLAFPWQWTYVSSEHVQRAVEAEAKKPDTRRKLIHDAAQRHLFVYVDPRRVSASTALVDEPPPSQGPSLPDEVTHVWAVAAGRLQGQFMVWLGTREGWCSLGSVAVDV